MMHFKTKTYLGINEKGGGLFISRAFMSVMFKYHEGFLHTNKPWIYSLNTKRIEYRIPKGYKAQSTPAVWKHYNKMAVLHFFRVNYILCIIYYLWVNAIFQKLSLKFRVTLQLTTVPSKLSFLAMLIKYSYFSI